jgi:hypothetical protein
MRRREADGRRRSAPSIVVDGGCTIKSRFWLGREMMKGKRQKRRGESAG